MKDIPGYEGRYAIEPDGRVYSHLVRRYLSPFSDRHGGQEVALFNLNDGKRHHHSIHTLVAITYLPNPRLCRFVRHKDGNKYNNKLENLEWDESTSACENLPVEMRDLEHPEKVLAVYDNVLAAAQEEFWDASKADLIAQCVEGIIDSAYEYYWTYANTNKEGEKMHTIARKASD